MKKEKYTLVEKAYKINFGKIEEGYLYDEDSFVVYAETLNKAKYKLLEKAYCENICLRGSDDEVTYITIPVIRAKEHDTFLFEGEPLTKIGIIKKLRDRDRESELNKILDDDSISHCYIKKGSYYRPNSCGYTDFIHRAGVFTKQKAVSSAMSCRDLYIIPIDIEKHNKMIQDEIDDLKTRLIYKF